MTEQRPVRPRLEPRDVVELKHLKAAQPDLTSAVDMQLALVEVNRRVMSRVPLPRIHPDAKWLAEQRQAGRPAIRFGDIPLDWTDFRLALRQTADVLHRHDTLDSSAYQRIGALLREGNSLEPLVMAWYKHTSNVDDGDTAGERPPAEFDPVLLLAMRPFLARCAEALSQRADFSGWQHGRCPFCGWEPDFAVITPAAERRLICGRCLAQWGFDALRCPYCLNNDRSRITSFTSRDGRYRVYACDVCRRYLKAYDGRNATRPVLVEVDTIATLPLDAAAMQRGYSG
jgi:formate dehydrogenase maturation protein FdhE